MNFLIVNDDGISSEGILALSEALAPHGDLYVCAPDRQQSGKSHSITLVGTIFVHETEYPRAKKAWRVNGTPADCTKIGIQFCKKMGVEIDIVFSGINKGSNLGADTLYSGTVGGAMEGVLLGYRAVAVSVNGHDASHFEAAGDLAVQSIPLVMNMEPGKVININTPDLPREEIKGIAYGILGPSFFVDGFVLKEGNEYCLEGEIPDYSHLGLSVDIGANSHGYATVTPLDPDFTDKELLKYMAENWSLSL